MGYRRLIILLICTLLLSCTFAQQPLNYLFRHITQADGLLNNQVLSMTQDSKGFIWVATPNGLQRYDGSRFVYYPEMLSNAAEGLTDGAEVYADKKNNLLWITKNGSIEKMQPGKSRFTIYTPDQLLSDTVLSFVAYRGVNNETWRVSNNAVHLYNKETGTSLYQGNIGLADGHRSCYISIDSVTRQTWVAMMSTVYLFDDKTRVVYSAKDNPIRHPLLNPSLYGTGEYASRHIMTDSRHNVWITTWGDRFYRYDPLTKKVSTYLISSIKSIQQGQKVSPAGLLINAMMEDDHSNVWLATENAGLLRYDREKDNFDFCVAKEKNSESIQYNYKIFTLFQDKEQNIWVGTDKGISLFNPYRQYFKSIRHEEGNPLTIGKSEIESFIQISNGDMYIGTWGGGIAVYDKTFNFKKNIIFTTPPQNNFVWSFAQYDDNTLWIGCQHGYLLQHTINNGTTRTLRPPEMEGSTIRCMEKDSKGNIWMGLHNGKLIKWDSAQNKFLPGLGDSQDRPVGKDVILNILIDRAQRGWVSTTSGFKEFDLEKRMYINTWLPDTGRANSISAKTSQGIEEYNDSLLLIGTTYGGLNFFNKKTKIFTHLGTADGLPSNTIYAIKKDSSGYVWFTTGYGLYKINPVDKKITPYNIEPGVINSSFMSNKFYALQDGQWLLFTTTEAISFFPRSLEQQSNTPKIEITGFKIFDTPILIDSLLYENKPVQLSYKENFFTVEFAALNFSGLQQISYAYRLQGIDKEWVHGGTKRFANYTDLQPGEYTFEVKAENGNSSGETISFKIIITPPFWKTWWFISACLVLIGLSVYWLFRKRVNAVRHEAAMKQTIAETRTMALRSQMNPHFIFNCLNSIDNLIQTDQKEKATDYLAKFARLIRAILENSKTNTIPCWKDLEALKLYLQMEELRWDKKISCDISIAGEIQNGDYKVPPMVIQPFVENAIHHGLLNKVAPDKKLTIDVKLESNNIKYTITDNGVGRAKAGEYKKMNRSPGDSLGIQITKDRISLFNQEANGSVKITDRYNEQHEPDGTIVEVWLTTQPDTI